MSTVTASYLSCEAASREQFRTTFDRKPFAFEHHLLDTGLFSMDAIQDLAERMAPKTGRWYFEQGESEAKAGWNAGASQLTLQEVLAGIATNRSLVLLKRVNEEPEYRRILDGLEEELSDMLGFDMGSRYYDGLMTVLVSSPGRVTPYHVDGQANLLMQMRGSKSIFIFDGDDRVILPARELEDFWGGDVNAPRYRDSLQADAQEFVLSPGGGVTNPVTFPHWVKNGTEVSISLSVNFKRIVDDVADAYKVNKQLRKIGLKPKAPGSAKTIDHFKGLAYRTAKQARQYLKK